MDKYDALKLENQLCFPLYAAAREVVKHYYPYLSEIDLTYTQYITMMVLWADPTISSKHLGERLFLDSGTLTPLLKGLENKGLITRTRDSKDERNLVVSLTQKGLELKERAVEIPAKIGGCITLSHEEAVTLYKTLYKILGELG